MSALPAGTDPSAEAAATVAHFQSAFDAHDVEGAMALMTADCVFEDTTPPDGCRHVGTDAVRTCWQELFRDAPDARFETEDTVTVGDRVVVRWRYSWGDGHVRGVDLFRVREGLVAEKLSYVKG